MKNICILIFIFFICSCTKNQEIEDDFKDSILVQIGNHIILKDELIQRSEYVIRPNYCSKNNNIHKQIILNSLIAEKLLAIEGKVAFNNVPINNYLKGLKEQSMREKLFFTKTNLLEKIGNFELNKFRKTADRIYNLSFINLNKTQAKAIIEDIKISSELTNNLFNTGNLNTKDVSFFGESNYRLCHEIFSVQHNKSDIIGPVVMDDGTYILIRVEDWHSERRLSENSQKEYMKKIRTHLTRLKSINAYGDYIHDIMKNKILYFNQTALLKLVKNYYHEHLKIEKSKKELIRKAIWPENKLALSGKYKSIDIGEDEVIFSLDDEEWTMAELQNLINVHPLVFRKNKISKKDFSKAVKNAISDLIRDNYLTEEAYKLKYDQDAYIIQYIKMWEQHFIASSLRLKLLKSKPSDLQEIKYLNPIINKLFLKYSDKIKIDFEILDEINLTSIPMHIVNKNAAYHSPIPQFPILTDNYKINYGVRRK
jgi:hypothetical protein